MNKPPRLRRRPGWEEALEVVLRQAAAEGFRWGHRDCALFAADAVNAQTGVDPAAVFRGRYRTEIGAARALTRFGAGRLEPTVDLWLPRHAAPGFATRGDIVAVPFGAGGTVGLAVVNPSGTGWVGLVTSGTVTGPMGMAVTAWRVG